MWAFSNGSVKDTLSSDISWVFLFLSQNHQMKTKLSFSLEEDSQRSFMRLGNVYLPWSFFYRLKMGNNCSLVTCYGIEYHLLSWKKVMNSFFFNWGAFQLSDKNEGNQCIVVKSILFLFLVAEMTSLWLWY